MKNISIGVKCSIPDWACYIAKDQDGTHYCYEFHPVLNDSVWQVSSGPVVMLNGDIQTIGGLYVASLPWDMFVYHVLLQDDGSYRVKASQVQTLFEMDEVVLVSTDGKIWLPRHFKGWSDDGQCSCWGNGRSSKTITDTAEFANWKYWKKYEG